MMTPAPRQTINYQALAEAFLECQTMIAEVSAQLKIPAPLVEYTAKKPRKNRRFRTLGLAYRQEMRFTLDLPENGNPERLRETAYHEFGHHVDWMISKSAFGMHYWLSEINRYSPAPALITINRSYSGEEDFADSVMIYCSHPDERLQRLGYARLAALEALFEYRGRNKSGTTDDPYAIEDYYPLLQLIRERVREAWLQDQARSLENWLGTGI